MSRLRIAARLVAMVVALLFALLLHGTWRLFRLPSPWPRRLLGLVGRIAGARVDIIGHPVRRDVVFLANHLSWIDILVLAGATGTAFVAKDELRRVPLIGWLCTLNHTLFVRRGDRMNVAEQIAQIAAALAQAWPITIFPEGTTGDGEGLLPFKATLLAALDPPPPGIVVQPVGIDYGSATGEIAWIGDEPGASHARRVLARPGSFPVRLHFLDAFDPTPLAGRKAIAAEAERRIDATLHPTTASDPAIDTVRGRR